MTPLVTAGLIGSFMDAAGRKPSHELTPRQRDGLQLLAEGDSMKRVAALLNVTPRTLAFHKYRMMEPLDIRSNAERSCQRTPGRSCIWASTAAATRSRGRAPPQW